MAHILAASASVTEWVDPEFNFGIDAAPEFEACFLRTILEYEARLQFAPNFPDWRMWKIATRLPQRYWSLPTLMPSYDTLFALLGPQNYAEIVQEDRLISAYTEEGG